MIQGFKKRFGNRFILLLVSFLFSTLPAQAAEQASSISLPSNLGRIDQIQNGTNGKTIVLIQSAHTHYEAQKALSEVLRYFVQNEILNLVLVEGGWGDVRLSYLRNSASFEKRLEVAERYLKEGKISGDEYLDLTSDLNMSLWGIENPDDYRANMEAFLKFYEVQNQLLDEVKKIEPILIQAETTQFSEELKEFSVHQRAFQTHQGPMLDYLTYLVDQFMSSPNVLIGDPHIDSRFRGNDKVLDAFPSLNKLIALTNDSTFDSAKLEVEKKNLMKALSAQVTKLELEQFSLATDRKSVDDERRYLRLLLDAYEAHASELPKLEVGNIKKCLAAFESMDQESPEQIFNEITALEEQVLNQFPLTEEQKQLIENRKSFELLQKLFSLELNSENYETIKSNPSSVILEPHTLSFPRKRESMDPRLKHSGMTNDIDGINFSLIEQWIPGAVLFYDSARKREAGLIQNAAQKIEETQNKTAALLIGGFHSEHLASEFHKLGYSVVIISPKFLSSDSKENSRQYFEILKYKWGAGDTVTPNLKLS